MSESLADELYRLRQENETYNYNNTNMQITIATMKTKLEKIKEILETTCWDYTDITVTKVKDDILQIIEGE